MLQSTSDIITLISVVLTSISIYLTYKTRARYRKRPRGGEPSWVEYFYRRTIGYFKDKHRFAGIGLTLSAALLWSVSNVSLKFLTVKGNDTIFVVAAMNFIGAISCFACAKVLGTSSQPQKTPIFTINDLLLIIGGNVLNALAFVYALRYISSSQLIILNKTNPLFLALLLYFVAGEKISLAGITAIVSTSCGIYVLVGGPAFEISFSDGGMLGSVLALVAGAAFAVFTYGLYQSAEHQSEAALPHRLWCMGWILLYSYVALVTIGFFFGYHLPKDAASWSWIAINGIRVAIVYLIYQQAIRLTHPILVSVVVSSEVLFTIILERLWLSTPITANVVLGAILILGAILSLIVEQHPQRRSVELTQRSETS
jgi:drug/metabolite transporter (DMT)-like permease